MALAACGGQENAPDIAASTGQELKGTADASLSLGGAWTTSLNITAKVLTPAGASAKSACLSLTEITAQAGETWTACQSGEVAVSGLSPSKPVTKALTLADRDGLQKVWVRFKGEGANATKIDSVKVSSIVVDRNAPVDPALAFDMNDGRAGFGLVIQRPALDLGGSGVKNFIINASTGASVTQLSPSKCAVSATVKAATCVLEQGKLFCGAVGGVAVKRGDKVAIEFCTVDNAGNISGGITLEPFTIPAVDPNHSPPSIVSNISLVNDTGEYADDGMTSDGSFRFAARARDGAVVTSWAYTTDGSNWTWTDLAASARAANVTLFGNAGFKDARKELGLKVKDSFGAESGVATREFTVDQTAPKTPVINNVTQQYSALALTVTNADSPDAFDEAPMFIVTASEKAPAPKCAETAGSFRVTYQGQETFSAGEFFLKGAMQVGRKYFLMACAIDRAGNISDGATTATATLVKDHKSNPVPAGQPLNILNTPDWPKVVGAKPLKVEIKARSYGASKLTAYTPAFVAVGSDGMAQLPETPAPTAIWTTFKKAKPVQLETLDIPIPATLKNGRYVLVVFVKDDIENVSGSYFTADFEYDTVAPTLALKNPVTVGGFAGMVAMQVDVEVGNAAATDALTYDGVPYASVVAADTFQLRFKSGIAAPAATVTNLAQCVRLDGEKVAFRCMTPFAFTLLANATANKVSFLANIQDVAGNLGTGKFAATASVPLEADTTVGEASDFAVSYGTGDIAGDFLFEWDDASGVDIVGYVLVASSPDSTEAPASCDEGTKIAYAVQGDGARREFVVSRSDFEYVGYAELPLPKAFRLCVTDLAGNLSPGLTAVLPD